MGLKSPFWGFPEFQIYWESTEKVGRLSLEWLGDDLSLSLTGTLALRAGLEAMFPASVPFYRVQDPRLVARARA